jgi:hypothetical protein
MTLSDDIIGVVAVLIAVTCGVIAAVFLVASASNPVFIFGFIVFSVACLLVLYYGLMRVVPPTPPQYQAVPQEAPAVVKPTPEETAYMVARLELPRGGFLPVTGANQVFGRDSLQGQVSASEANVISRAHFEISVKGSKFFVEDKGSKNGTLLNRKEIKGTGPHEIEEGDTISPAGTIELRFRA